MKRIFTTNLLLLVFVNILIKPFWIFGIDRTVQNTLGAGEYGIFYTLFNLSLLFSILLDFGLTNFNNREISRHPQLLGKYLSNIVGIKVVLAIFYGLFTLLFAFTLGYANHEIVLLLVLVANQVLSSFILYLRSNLSGLQLFKLDSLLSVLDKTLMIIICGMMLWTKWLPIKFNIGTFVLSQTLSYVLTAVIAFIFVLKNSGKVILKLDFLFSLSMLKSSFPYALLILLMTIYSRVDSVLIERLIPNGDIAAGVYAQAFRLLDAANMFPFLFASLLLPIFSKMIKNNNNLSPFVGFSSILLLVPVVSFAIPTFVFRNHIMELLYVEHTVQSSQVLGILMGSFVFMAIGYIFGTLLTAQGDLLKLNYVSAVAVVISIFAQYMLIGRFGIVGAAYGNLITSLFVAIFTLMLAFQRYEFKIDKSYWYRSFVFIVTSIIATLLLYNAKVNPLVSLVIAFLLIILFSLVFKLIRFKELASFFTKEAPFE